MRKPFLLLFVFAFTATHLFAQVRPVVRFDSCKTMPIPHRGYDYIYPESSVLALEESFKRGAKIIEIDTKVTKDDRMVSFHDEPALNRTTNGTGAIEDHTLSELQSLDAGSWKGYYFKGTTIPTLEDVLLLAEKYNGILYLDMDDYRFDLVKDALASTGVSANRVMPDLYSLDQVNDYHTYIPKGPWVWYNGGLIPDSVNIESYFKACAALNCYAMEVGSQQYSDPNWTTMVKYCHKYNIKIWTFTENRLSIIKNEFLNDVDGIETDNPWTVSRYFCAGDSFTSSDSFTTGNWRFENSLSGKGVGSQLRAIDYLNPDTQFLPRYNTCSGFGIPSMDTTDPSVMLVPKQDSAHGLFVYPDFSVDDKGSENGRYTLIMDILVPSAYLGGGYIALLQTSTTNSDDADIYISPGGGVGIQGTYDGTMLGNTWYRLAFTIDYHDSLVRKYINGKYVGSNITYTDRWTVLNTSSPGIKQGFLLFADYDVECAPIYMSSLQTREYVMDSNAIKALGGPASAGIPVGDANIYNVSFNGAIADSTLADFENHTYYLTVPSYSNLKKVQLSYDLSFGATASKSTTSLVDLSSGSYTVNIKSQDKNRTTPWTFYVNKMKPQIDTVTDTVVVTDTVFTGIEKNKHASYFSIYPNPVNETLTIKSSAADVLPYTIFDMYGRQVGYGKTEGELTTVHLSALPQGVYIINMQGGTMIRFLKM